MTVSAWVEILTKLEPDRNATDILIDAKTLHSLSIQELSKTNSVDLVNMQKHVNSRGFFTNAGEKFGTLRKKVAKEYLQLLDIEFNNRDLYPICNLCKSVKNIRFFKCRHSFCDDCGHYGHSYVYCPICNETFFEDPQELSFDHMV
jgi:hypothetical protein